jgi:hypothetical protein
MEPNEYAQQNDAAPQQQYTSQGYPIAQQQHPQQGYYQQQHVQPQPTQYQPSYVPQYQPPTPVYNTRGSAMLREDYSLGGYVGLNVMWLESLITRYKQGDVNVIDTDPRTNAPNGMLKLSMSAKYKPSQSGKSSHSVTFYVRADLPTRGY